MIINRTMNILKIVCQCCKKSGHVIKNCRKGMKKGQEQKNVPSINNHGTSDIWIICTLSSLPRTNRLPEKRWSGPNGANRHKQFLENNSADNRIEGQEQGNLTHSRNTSILKNPFNKKNRDSNGQATHQ